MEEDIKKIQERIIEPFYDFPNPISIELKDNDVELIENLIADNKRLDKENQALFEAYNFNDTNLLAKILKEYRKETKDSIPKSKAEELLEKLDKEEKQELKGVKGQDRYFMKQIYQAKRNTIEELLQEGDK